MSEISQDKIEVEYIVYLIVFGWWYDDMIKVRYQLIRCDELESWTLSIQCNTNKQRKMQYVPILIDLVNESNDWS